MTITIQTIAREIEGAWNNANVGTQMVVSGVTSALFEVRYRGQHILTGSYDEARRGYHMRNEVIGGKWAFGGLVRLHGTIQRIVYDTTGTPRPR